VALDKEGARGACEKGVGEKKKPSSSRVVAAAVGVSIRYDNDDGRLLLFLVWDHAVRGGSDASAAAYVQLQADDGRLLWGAGIDSSIEMAGLRALVSAWNLMHR
jgi:hypothetical protein